MRHNYWACFMFLVAVQSLEDRRRALWKAESLAEAQVWGRAPEDKTPEELRAERRVNRALIVVTKYKPKACENCRARVARSGL